MLQVPIKSDEMTLQQYADERGITVQAVFSSFSRHKADMTGMYRKDGKHTPTIFTAEGVAFMDSVRKKQVIEYSSLTAEQEAELKTLQKENAELLQQIADMKADFLEKIDEKDARIERLMDSVIELNAEIRSKDALLLEEKDKVQTFLLSAATEQKKGLFGRLFGKRENNTGE